MGNEIPFPSSPQATLAAKLLGDIDSVWIHLHSSLQVVGTPTSLGDDLHIMALGTFLLHLPVLVGLLALARGGTEGQCLFAAATLVAGSIFAGAEAGAQGEEAAEASEEGGFTGEEIAIGGQAGGDDGAAGLDVLPDLG